MTPQQALAARPGEQEPPEETRVETHSAGEQPAPGVAPARPAPRTIPADPGLTTQAQRYVECHEPQSKAVSEQDKVPNQPLEAEHRPIFTFREPKRAFFLASFVR